jgi:hypothetical protein
VQNRNFEHTECEMKTLVRYFRGPLRGAFRRSWGRLSSAIIPVLALLVTAFLIYGVNRQQGVSADRVHEGGDSVHGGFITQFDALKGNVGVDQIVNFLLELSSDETGLDVNEDGGVNVADIIRYIRIDESNLAPVVTSLPIYRAYPGYTIELPILATDPEETALLYASTELPAGAVLDEGTGVLTWTPTDGQIGPAYIHYSVSDSAASPRSSSGILIFQIEPLSDGLLF